MIFNIKKIKLLNMKKTKSLVASTVIVGTITLQGPSAEAQGVSANEKNSTEAIRPVQVHISQEDLVDLRKRVLATRWPSPELVKNETQGVQFATTQALARYWSTDYDWRKLEAKLNAYPQFITKI